MSNDLWAGAFGTESQVRKYRPDQARDSRGRFTDDQADAAGRQFVRAARLGNRHPGDVLGAAKALGAAAIGAVHDRAADLASKVGNFVTSTRFHGASPIHTGGVEIRGVHSLGKDDGTQIVSHVQVHPWSIPATPVAQAALSAVNHGLARAGVSYVPMRAAPISVTFQNRKDT